MSLPRKTKAAIIAAAAAAALLAGCSTAKKPFNYAEPEKGDTALLRVGGEGEVVIRRVANEDRDSCFMWDVNHNHVLRYIEGETKAPPANLPYQGRSLGIPESSATKRFPDKNRWAELRIPSGVELEIQYNLPYDKVPGSAPELKADAEVTEVTDLGGLCRAGFRMKAEPGKSYQASFSWSRSGRNYSCGAVFTTLPDEKIHRVKRLDSCHTVDYENLFTLEGTNLNFSF